MGPDPKTITQAAAGRASAAAGRTDEGGEVFAGLNARLSLITKAQQGRLLLWSPVALGTGVAAYFGLGREPGWAVFVLLAAIAVLIAVASVRVRVASIGLLVAFVAGGMVLAKVRTELVRAPALAASSGPVTLSGWVNRIVNATGRNPRVLIDVESITGLHQHAWPARVQLTVFKPAEMVLPGDFLTLSARLFPLPGPVAPGGYDHGRTLWFQGIGATGRGKIVDPAQAVAGAPDKARFNWRRPVDNLRAAINARIEAALPRELSGFAIALITGDRSLVNRAQREELATAGLAHVLAISGLHMSLVAGGTFWLIRALLALFPALVLNWPIKKWAAVAAICVGTFYLLISGASISTQRAYIMLAIMLLAVLMDRPAISLRNLAIAALIVLLIAPEAVATASFQMSFMAVMGLIATYEAINVRRNKQPGNSSSMMRPWPWPVRMVLYGVSGLVVTTIVASIFTGLPAAYHFNRIGPYSLLANLLALPVVTFLVMPSAMLATLLMPIGLEDVPLWLMGQGLDYVQDVSRFVVSIDGSVVAVAAMQGGFVLAAAYGAIWLCVAHGPVRLIGGAVAIVALVTAPAAESPDLLIERTAKNVAVRNGDGRLALAHQRRGRFAGERWLRSDGDRAGFSAAVKREGWTCADQQCLAERNGRKIIYYMDDAKVAGDCSHADIVIAQFPLRGKCSTASVHIDRFDVWRSGAHAIFLDGGEARVVTAREGRGQRPWVIEPVARKTVRTDGGKPLPASRHKSGQHKPSAQ